MLVLRLVTLYKRIHLITGTAKKEILTITQDQANMFDDSNSFPDLNQVNTFVPFIY